MAAEITLLSDVELRKKLRSFNLPDGPITKTTRKLFETKLKRAMGLHQQVDKNTPQQEQGVYRHLSEGDKGPSCVTTSNHDCMMNDSSVSNSPHTTESGNPQVVSDNRDFSMFYGVCLLEDGIDQDLLGSRIVSVFTDKSEALHCVKKNNGARFRAFSTRNEAEAFAAGKLHTPSRQHSQELPPVPVEPTSEYKGPKHGEITHFRKVIETGELDEVSKLIYGNPRYLITSADTPVILQEGCHYNSMHIAARAGQKDICKLIINTLHDDNFWRLLYPFNEKAANNQQQNKRRKGHLLDLFLNTPDKGGCETPLHFACKFGKAAVVEYLLSCPEIERIIRNKDGKTAEQVICARVPDCDDELRSRIQSLFDKSDTVCVPILRSEDNCSSPKVGTPWSPSLRASGDDFVDAGSPGEPRYKVRAYAGPMSPQEAEKFCYALRSPRATPEKQAKFRNIKRSDSEKGLERVARKVAKSQNVLWCEYWKFLDCFTDISTSEGLTRLEEYLRAKTETYMQSNVKNAVPLETPIASRCPPVGSLRGLSTGDDVFADGSESTPRSGKREISAMPCSGKFINPNIKNFRGRLNLDESPGRENAPLNYKENDNNDLSPDLVSSELVDEDYITVKTEHDSNSCQDKQTNEEKLDCSRKIEEQLPVSPNANSLSPDLHKGCLNNSNCSEDSLSGLVPEFGMLSLDESPKSGDESSHHTSVVSGYTSPEYEACCEREDSSAIVHSNICSFIEGLQPSKVDLDVFRSIKSTTIDPVAFPCISRWQKMVCSFSKATRQAWPSPGSPRYYKTRRGIPKTSSC